MPTDQWERLSNTTNKKTWTLEFRLQRRFCERVYDDDDDDDVCVLFFRLLKVQMQLDVGKKKETLADEFPFTPLPSSSAPTFPSHCRCSKNKY